MSGGSSIQLAEPTDLGFVGDFWGFSGRFAKSAK